MGEKTYQILHWLLDMVTWKSEVKNRLSGIATICLSYFSEILTRTAGDLLNVEGQGVHFSENVSIKHIFHISRNHIYFHMWTKSKWFPDFSYLESCQLGQLMDDSKKILG